MDSEADVLEAAAIHQSEGRLAESEDMIRRLLARQPGHAEAWHRLGIVRHLQGCSGEAVEMLKQSVALDPSDWTTLSNLGEILRGRGELVDARHHLLRAAELAPDSADVCNNLGIVLWNLGAMEDAIEWCGRAVRSRPDFPEALNNLGIALEGAGRHDEAVEYFRRALKSSPEYPGALNNLGNALRRAGCMDEAIECFLSATRISPGFGEAYNNLGNALREAGRPVDAEACCRRALELVPEHPGVWNNLGNALKDLGRAEEACECYRRALGFAPGFAEANLNLGVALRDAGHLEEAIVLFERVLESAPESAVAHNHLGVALQEAGRLGNGVFHLRRAVEIRPDFADAWNHLGIAVQATGDLAQAMTFYRRAIEMHPGHAGALNNLGIALQNTGRVSEAIDLYRHALESDPSLTQAGNNLGIALQDTGRFEEAIACYRRILEGDSSLSDVHSNLLLTLQYAGECDAESFLAEARKWNDRQAFSGEAFVARRPRGGAADGPIRVGYVSPDFRRHSIAFFVESLLDCHDSEQFEVFCYADVVVPDPVTARLRSLVRNWRSTVGLSHRRFVEAVRSDRIDILVDLAGHTAGNRLPAFALRSAPVQATWLGFPGTTGLEAMDWRLTDRFAEGPESLDTARYSERLYRLPESFLCYRPDEQAPPVAPLPGGPVTFGCFNAPSKLNPALLDLWAEILRRLPGSRLLLKNYTLGDPPTRRKLVDRMAASGISPDRLDLVLKMASFDEHMRAYGRIHVALDTYPYHGTTTTCESLWMGVPVVSLAGPEHRSRVGVSLLSQIGFGPCLADSPAEYVEKAVGLAGDGALLSEWRDSLRDRLRASPLMDAPGFARAMEGAYRAFLDGPTH